MFFLRTIAQHLFIMRRNTATVPPSSLQDSKKDTHVTKESTSRQAEMEDVMMIC